MPGKTVYASNCLQLDLLRCDCNITFRLTALLDLDLFGRTQAGAVSFVHQSLC
jgi:hypothetical protein